MKFSLPAQPATCLGCIDCVTGGLDLVEVITEKVHDNGESLEKSFVVDKPGLC